MLKTPCLINQKKKYVIRTGFKMLYQREKTGAYSFFLKSSGIRIDNSFQWNHIDVEE